jgi:hypothetical protein
LRKYIDVAVSAPSSKLILVDANGEQAIECLGQTGFPFFGQLILDCITGDEKAMTQSHCFKAAELSMCAQALADEQHFKRT